jgi:hypothetical protein
MSPEQYYWVIKLQWAQLFIRFNGNLHLVKYRINWNEMKGKDKLIALNWDSSFQHSNCKEIEKNTGINVKKGMFYSIDCKHAKNQKLLDKCNCESVVAQVANGMVGKKARKVVRCVIVVYLL